MYVRSLLSGLLFGAMSLVTVSALAFNRTGVGLTIVDVSVFGSNARITVSGTLSGTVPACHTSGSANAFGLNLGTDKGRAQLSIAVAAMLAGKTVNITGPSTNTCVATDAQTQDTFQLTLNP